MSFKSSQYFIGTSNNGKFVSLLTIDNFSDKSCNSPLVFVINKFNRITRNWTKPLEGYKKFTNFYGCPLIVTDNFGPFLYPKKRFAEISECFTKDPRNCLALLTYLAATTGLQGVAVDLFSMVAKIANFTPKYELRVNERRPMMPARPPEVRVYVSNYDQLLKGYSPTSLHFASSFILAATPSEYYNNYEKLWLPFDCTTWILLLLTLILAFSVIFGLNFVPKFIRKSFIGVNITTPALNFVQIFLDNSLTKLPKSSLARFILIMFIWFCLIFRTLYQSKSFDFMTSDVRKAPPCTVQDLIDRNYTIVTFSTHEKILNEMIPDVDKM